MFFTFPFRTLHISYSLCVYWENFGFLSKTYVKKEERREVDKIRFIMFIKSFASVVLFLPSAQLTV